MDDFTFAGFNFPRAIAMLPCEPLAQRVGKKRYTGPYSHAPKPIVQGTHPGGSFYHDSDFAPGLRFTWCDEVSGVRIRHTGWFCDEYQSAKIRGLVFRLPHGRGFLAAWSMGEGMASAFDGSIYDREANAAWAADSLAENAAEAQREHEAEYERERDEAEAAEESAEVAYWNSRDIVTQGARA
jgi:hypothetical protein